MAHARAPHQKTWRKRLQHSILGFGLVALCGLPALLLSACVLLPGDRFAGPLPITESAPTSAAARLRSDVEALAGAIGERNMANHAKLRLAANFIAAELGRAGYVVRWQTLQVTPPGKSEPLEAWNLIAEIPASAPGASVIVVGAHYDSVGFESERRGSVHSPGANDNASGTAAVLELARRLAGTTHPRAIRFVFFANEEPPYFWTDQMGSLIYARQAKRQGDDIAAMLSIETIGTFSDAPGSQHYPPLVGLAYPDKGNFVAFVGMASAEALVRRCVASFRSANVLAAEGAALPTLVPRVGSSDHWSFWAQGYPALMVTDTAPYRSPDYHKPTDTPEKLNYEAMALVVEGLVRVIDDLASEGPEPAGR